jgi:hypothetical protein
MSLQKSEFIAAKKQIGMIDWTSTHQNLEHLQAPSGSSSVFLLCACITRVGKIGGEYVRRASSAAIEN